MIKYSICLIVLMIGCKSQTPVILASSTTPTPQVQSASPVKSDCHTSEMAAELDEDKRESRELPYWMTHNSKCPANRRKVEPSEREVNKATHLRPYSNDEWMNWQLRHTVCVPDGL
jgi:hypothetical protein